MHILKNHKGYQLIERYGRNYIRFWGGREENMPCEIPVSEAEAKQVVCDANVIDELISVAKRQIEWAADAFYKIGIIEYLLYYMKISPKRAEMFYKKLARHSDIRNEFYWYIMNDEAFTSNPINIEGLTACYLTTNYPLSVLGAYNYLIDLRENPDKALADLKAGLPRK